MLSQIVCKLNNIFTCILLTFQMLSSPTTLQKPHTRLLVLLISIMISSIGMSTAAYYSDFADNLNIFGFMLAEVQSIRF